MFWKRASGKSAFITLIAGMVLGFVAFYLDWNNIYRGDFMLIAFLLLVACLVIMVATTFLFPEPLKAKPGRWSGRIGASRCAARRADAAWAITASQPGRCWWFLPCSTSFSAE